MATGGFLPRGGGDGQKLVKDGGVPGVGKWADDYALQDEEGNVMPRRPLWQIKGVEIADDEQGGRTVVTVAGGSGGGGSPVGLRQLDLYLPGKFAAAATLAALAAAKDFATWELEPAAIRYIKVRCAAADSGATPCSVQLMVNAAAVGGTVQAVASSWTTLAITGVTLNTGDQIEIAVTDAGSNGDSADLRFVVVAEV